MERIASTDQNVHAQWTRHLRDVSGVLEMQDHSASGAKSKADSNANSTDQKVHDAFLFEG